METYSALLAICARNSPVNSPHKGQWRWALMFSFICVWINGWVDNREAGDLRRYRAHYDVTVMFFMQRRLYNGYIWHGERTYVRTRAESMWVLTAWYWQQLTCNIAYIFLAMFYRELFYIWILWIPWQQGLWSQHGAHQGPIGPRWVPCWVHRPCYLGDHFVIGPKWPNKRVYLIYNKLPQSWIWSMDR